MPRHLHSGLVKQIDRATLIRRASFDVTGFPPTNEETQAFTSDPAPDAWVRVVDRLLASPHFGERWARHWLDVVRFGESHGFEFDNIRPNAWRYRDYVIESFNQDKSYFQFVTEQLCGDGPTPATDQGIIATAFLSGGPWDQAGYSSSSASVKGMVREAELEDLIGTVGQTFLGLTINCARCHDHKFDPIPQGDYYRLKAVFQGVHPSERELGIADLNLTNRAKVYGIRTEAPGKTFVLRRGEHDQPRDLVTPGAISAISKPDPEWALPSDSPEWERRFRLAQWITHPENPLAARVIVNRLWQHYFGRGIVATPNDFGRLGETPSDLPLLDFLASQLWAHHGSLKAIHRLILLSESYQRNESQGRRLGPRRLEAETIRDAMLRLSGELEVEMGGPSYRNFRQVNSGNQNEYFPEDRIGREFNRRTIYRLAVHSGRDPMLDSLDCPEFSNRTPVRPSTTTPLQALSLMNSSFVQRQSERWAERLSKQIPNQNPDAKKRRISLAWQEAYSRLPSTMELESATTLAAQRGLTSVCWTLFNSSEWVFVR